MPGGSVNGRPFRESSDSYSRTGIPCGNPKRFKSHDVVRMEPDRKTASKPLVAGPGESVETEGQIQLQALLHKQMDTNITLQEQLGARKQFCRAAELQPGSEGLEGVVALDTYRTREQTDTHLDDLRAFGLTNEEMLYLMQHEDGEQSAKRSKLSNPDYHSARLAEIREKIQQKQHDWQKNDSFAGVKQLSRHAMEVEKSLSQAANQNSFLHKMLVREADRAGTSPAQTSSNTMANLPEILETVTNRKQRRKEIRHTAGYKSGCTLECCNQTETSGCHDCGKEDCDTSCGTNASVPTCIEKPNDYVSRLEPENSKTGNVVKKKDVKTQAKPTSFTVSMDKSASSSTQIAHSGGSPIAQRRYDRIAAGPSVARRGVLLGNVEPREHECGHRDTSSEHRELPYIEPVPEEAIQKYKLSSEEILKLPRFENYSPGEPSPVLYVKNLSPKVSETDLASLFIGFQTAGDDRRIVFKLLTGRMKGQAFVTFPDVDTATRALHLVHGYDFKGKPIVVQYGKKQAP